MQQALFRVAHVLLVSTAVPARQSASNVKQASLQQLHQQRSVNHAHQVSTQILQPAAVCAQKGSTVPVA